MEMEQKQETPRDANMPLRQLLCHDYAWFHGNKREPIYVEMSWAKIVGLLLKSSKCRLLFLIRLMGCVYVKGYRKLAVCIRKVIFFLYGAEISGEAEIGPGLKLPHPHGVIIGGHTRLGKYVYIAQFCTLGGNFGKEDESGRRFPTITDHVKILAGSIVVGPITIGQRAIIGPNSVVVRDIEEDTVVSGVPAEPIKVKGQRVTPLEKRVAMLEWRLKALEEDTKKEDV